MKFRPVAEPMELRKIPSVALPGFASVYVDVSMSSDDGTPYDPDGDPGDLPTDDDPIVLPPPPPSGPVGPA